MTAHGFGPAEQEALQDIGSDYEERFGFHDPENYLFKAPKGLTRELVDMITAQRVYQANAQTIKTQDQVLQTLINLR